VIFSPELVCILARFFERSHLVLEILGFRGLGKRVGLQTFLSVLRFSGY
jgi:hypothetical protein